MTDPRFRHPHALLILLSLLLTATAWSAPLATFTCREYLGRDWPRTLVTYPVTFARGQVRTDRFRLLDAQGQAQPCQLWRARTYPDGSLAGGRLSFYAALAKNGNYQFQLVPGASTETPPVTPTNAPPVAVTTGSDGLKMDNGAVAIRLPPAGDYTFATPLRFGADHIQMIKWYGSQAAHGIAPGPFQGVRLLDGRWVGGSYFFAKNPTNAPGVLGYSCRIVEQGPLFTEAQVAYRMEGGRYYQMTVRMFPGDPAIRIDEQSDLKHLDVGGVTAQDSTGDWQLVMSFTRGWEPGGWNPDYAFWGRYNDDGMVMKSQKTDIEPRLKNLGFDFANPNYGTCRLDYTQPATRLFALEPWERDPVASYFGLVDGRALGEKAATTFLAVMPMHAGNWRGDGPRHNKFLYSHRADDAAIHWPLGVIRHPSSNTHFGEYDPTMPYTFVRRQWSLIGGALQAPAALDAYRLNEGYVNLDDYKDWVLDWPQDPNVAYPRLYFTKKEVARTDLSTHPAAEMLKSYLYFTNNPTRFEQLWGKQKNLDEWSPITGDINYDLSHWYSSWRQMQWTQGWIGDLEELLASPSLSSERRQALRRYVAAFCYLQSEPDMNPRGNMINLGTLNMTINRFLPLTFGALLIPDHPRAKEWLTVSAQYVNYKLASTVAPGGGWSELFTYYDASAPALQHATVVLDRAGYLPQECIPVIRQLAEFPLRFMSPPDPRFGMRRMIPCWGHEGRMSYGHWLPVAGLLRVRDPDAARSLLWAWEQTGRYAGMHDASLNARAIWYADLLNTVPAGYVPPELNSAWVPGIGAVLRAHPGDSNETFLAYRQGYFINHCDDNQGDFVLFSKGAPLVDMSLFQYALHQNDPYIDLNRHFGWYSIPRFGTRDNVADILGGLGANTSPQAGAWNPSSAVHAYSFSPTLDYLRGHTDNEGRRWTRQIVFLKGKAAAGPNYFVFRDSFDSLNGDPAALVRKWWTIRTVGHKERVTATPTGLTYTGEFGPGLQVRFLQPATVAAETREGSRTYRTNISVQPSDPWLTETLAVTSFGPIAADQDCLVALYPQAKGEAAPAYEALADGALKIATSEGTDYVFVNRRPFVFARSELAFRGRAGAVRVSSNDVQLVIAEGPGELTYRGITLKSAGPATRVIPRAELDRPQVIAVSPAPPVIAFALAPRHGKVVSVQPGVRKQVQPHGVAYAFDSPTPIAFAQDGVTFVGRAGGLVVDRTAQSVRLVMLDGERIGCGTALAWDAEGPYDVTFFPDRLTGHSAGAGRILNVRQPAGIDRVASLEIDGLAYAPGSSKRYDAGQRVDAPGVAQAATLSLPLLPGEHRFVVHNLAQPPIWRNWQAW